MFIFTMRAPSNVFNLASSWNLSSSILSTLLYSFVQLGNADIDVGEGLEVSMEVGRGGGIERGCEY